MDKTLQRLQETAQWATTQTDRREVSILKEDLFWLVEELTKWQMVKDGDFDLSEDINTITDADRQHDLQTESRSWLQEVIE